MNDISAQVGPRAGRREWLGLAVLALPALLTSLDIGGLFLALPHLTASLGASSVQQLWISDIYGFMLAGFLVTMGTLGDKIGRRKLLLVGGTVFGILSVVAAHSTSPEMLIITRALLGIAGATLMPSTLALVSNMFQDTKQRFKAISLVYTCMMVGSALGPVVGGLLLQNFWWGSVFMLAVPVMVVLLVTGPLLLPEYRDPNSRKLDPVSVVLSLAAALPIIYGIKEFAIGDLGSSALPAIAIVVGLVCGVVFVRRQRTSPTPLLDVSLFRNRSFSAILTAMLLAAACMAGTFLLVSQYVQSVLGFSPEKAGLWLAPTGLAIAIGSMVAPSLGQRMKHGTVMAGGLALGVAGFVLISLAHSTTAGLAFVVVGLVAIHFGAGPLLALGTGQVVGSAPPEKAGAAASLSETSNYLGSMTGIALLGTLGALVYRHQIAGSIPAGVPAHVAAAARQTVAGATAAAPKLPAASATPLLHVARDAFTTGLNTAAVIGAVVFVGLTILVATALRQRRSDAAPATEAQQPATETVPN